MRPHFAADNRREMTKAERLIKIGAVSTAASARRALLSEGIHTRLTKTETSKEGCIWGLKIEEGKLMSAIMILRRLGTPYELP